MNTQLIAINPWFYTQLGHNYNYLKSVEKATLQLGWEFQALIPKKNLIASLPQNWHKTIDCPTVRHWFALIENRPYKRPRKLTRAKERFLYYHSMFFSLKKTFVRKTKKILFLETFALSDIKLLIKLIPFLFQKDLELWLIFRYPSTFIKDEIAAYANLFNKAKKSNIPLKLLVDTDLLQEDLSKCFGLPFHVLPIPMNQMGHSEPPRSFDKSQILCWWPGLVRAGKGLSLIQKFAASKHELNKQFKLIAARSAQLISQPNGPNIDLLPDDLSNDDYMRYLNLSDFILLPYTDPSYEKNSSNILVEAVCAGKIPVVYPNTWMTHELKKFFLDELILDWENCIISKELLAIFNNSNIRKKLKVMQDHYIKHHSIENYSQTMLNLSHHN